MPQEKKVGGLFSVDLDVVVDLSAAMESDSIEDTVSYAELHEIVKRQMEIPAALLEHVACRIAKETIRRYPKILEVEVRVTKMNPPMGGDCKGAGVTIHLINK